MFLKYELDTIYQAFVDTGHACHRMYFMFDENWQRNGGMICIKDACDVDWTTLPLDTAPNFAHPCSYGTWHLRISADYQPEWKLHKKNKHGTYVYIPVISKADDTDPQVKDDLHGGMKGKHHDALIEDDMADAFAYGMTKKEDVEKEVKQVVDWWKMVKLGDKKMSLDSIRKMFNECTSKKGGNEMHKELYHVILFNRKTEKIDYKAYIVAIGEMEAGMTAAHDYEKYDGKIHKHIVKLIEGSEYEVVK